MSRILSFIIIVGLTGCSVVVLVYTACIAHFGKFYMHESILYMLIPEIILTIIIIVGGRQKEWHETHQWEPVMTIPGATPARGLGSFKSALDTELYIDIHT